MATFSDHRPGKVLATLVRSSQWGDDEGRYRSVDEEYILKWRWREVLFRNKERKYIFKEEADNEQAYFVVIGGAI